MGVVLRSDRVRGEDTVAGRLADTLLYVLNRPGNRGFFLVAGDMRVGGVLAASEQGHLDLDSIPPASGLSLFMSRLPGYFEAQLQGGVGDVDAGIDDPLNPDYNPNRPRKIQTELIGIDGKPLKPEIDLYKTYKRTYSDWWEAERISPLLGTIAWHQGKPFSRHAKNGHAGCVPIAVAQIMAYHEYPRRVGAISVDWKLLKDNSKAGTEEYKKMAGELLREIGAGVHADFEDSEGTGASDIDALKFLRDCHYSEAGFMFRYIYDVVLINVKLKRPVYMGGYSGRRVRHGGMFSPKFGTGQYTGGHAWVVDGYIRRARNVTYDYYLVGEKRAVVEEENFFHCNWGWNLYNGYFKAGVFNADIRVNKPLKVRGENSLDFQYKVEQSLTICP